MTLISVGLKTGKHYIICLNLLQNDLIIANLKKKNITSWHDTILEINFKHHLPEIVYLK